MKKQISNNKILVISHQAVVDGMGSVILGTKYYDKIDYILCETKDLKDIFKEDFTNYNVVYVCDLPINDEAIESIENNNYLKEHIKHFDHHESMIKDTNPSYINEVIKIDDIPTSGTHLFYNHLLTLNNKLDNSFYKSFVECVRAYDTWDFNGEFERGKRITNLFGMLGIDLFLESILSLDDTKEFVLSPMLERLIENDEKLMNEYIENACKNVCICDFEDKKMAVVINEKYRSSLGHEICTKNPDIDFALIINFERKSASLRANKDDIDLGLIASKFHHNGGGHKKSSGFSLDEESIPKLKKYIDLYLNNIK